MMPLTLMQVGDNAQISRISGSDDTRRFLQNLGFVSQAAVELVNKLNGNVIVNIKDSRIAINEEMARHILAIDGDSAYKRRIMDMGITKGTDLFIRKVAPLGDPVEITVRGYELSVRKGDAACVSVKTVKE